jgi:hypothetical protein
MTGSFLSGDCDHFDGLVHLGHAKADRLAAQGRNALAALGRIGPLRPAD